MERPRVVIVGAGFGGLACARALAGKPVEVALLDRNNYHLFTPLLYQVASSLLNPSEIAYPIRTVFRKARNVKVRRAEVRGVDLDRRAVLLADGGEVRYDRLVLATGSTTNFFGMAELERRALGLKDLPAAMQLRNHILTCFEEAAARETEEERRPFLTFVVVGGGPTGVEYAGALSELIRLVLVKDFPELDLGEVRIVLVELLDTVLGTFRRPLGEYAGGELRRRGIDLRLGRRLEAAAEDSVTLSGGESIATRTLVWAAGVKPAGLAFALDAPRTRGGRVIVDEFLRPGGREDVFAIGDAASFVQDGEELPMMAPPAMQQGRHVAANLLRERKGRPLRPFRYRDKGAMATIGRRAAVAQTDRFTLTGWVGWVAWLALHLLYLIGFRNRLLVLFHWGLEYFRYDRPVRLIARARDSDRDR